MREDSYRKAVALVTIGWCWAALGVDAPHTAAMIQNSVGCNDCHSLHTAVGPGQTNQPDNFTLCTSCHNAMGAQFGFGGSWYSSDQATPGSGGHSHRWNTNTANAAYGASTPTDPGLLSKSPDNVIQCSTCHDQHKAGPSNAPLNVHLSVATGTALAQTGGAASGATMTLTYTAGTLAAQGYRVRIGPATNQFQVSHDARNGWGAASWGAAYTITAPNTNITLSADDPLLRVSFSAMPTATGGYWDFYVSYPHLRMSVAEGQLCVNCHAVRDQTHTDVETTGTYGWGTGEPFSHPVGQGLNANGKGYDVDVPLEVQGAVQGSAAGSNYLRLSPTGKVTCLSCHAAHNADSNSQTVDAR